jgi:hypothetical protein
MLPPVLQGSRLRSCARWILAISGWLRWWPPGINLKFRMAFGCRLPRMIQIMVLKFRLPCWCWLLWLAFKTSLICPPKSNTSAILSLPGSILQRCIHRYFNAHGLDPAHEGTGQFQVGFSDNLQESISNPGYIFGVDFLEWFQEWFSNSGCFF